MDPVGRRNPRRKQTMRLQVCWKPYERLPVNGESRLLTKQISSLTLRISTGSAPSRLVRQARCAARRGEQGRPRRSRGGTEPLGRVETLQDSMQRRMHWNNQV